MLMPTRITTWLTSWIKPVAQEAKQAYHAALTINPTLEEAKYNLAALGELPPPPSTPYPYLLRLFDSYAPSFDQHLVDALNYVVPEKLYEAVRAASPEAAALDVIDLGCGTGLVGQHFRKVAGRLTGIDISARMLQWAERRNVYDRLVLGDYVHYLSARQEPCDVVLAADVFIYAGDLVAVFQALPGCYALTVSSRSPWKPAQKPITCYSPIDAMPTRWGISIDWPDKPIFAKWRSILSI